MSVKHAVLGLIIERRGYGHELAARLAERLASEFEVPSGTFYTALLTLQRDGHVEVARRVPRGRSTRVYYDATEAGLRHFDEWMAEPLSREPLRGELYLRLAFVDHRRLSTLVRAFERLEVECVAAIARHTQARNPADEIADPVPLTTAIDQLVLSGVLDRLHAEQQLVTRTLMVLRMAESRGEIPRATLLKVVADTF